MFYILFYLLLFIGYATNAQITDAPQIKTVFIKNESHEFSSTIHPLNSSFTFGFDDIEGTQDEYYYLITHCEIDWTPSNIPMSYFINGFNNMQINNMENSFGTLQNYTHYEFTIPNEDTKITKSGNYLFQILNVENEVVCERRIVIYENKVSINIKISESRDLASFNEKQAISLVIQNNTLPINYPNSEIKTFIFQNGDQQIKSPFLTPTFVNTNTYTYRPSKETEFIAGNEFLNFDNNEILRNTRYISSSYREENYFNTILFTQKNRANGIYTYNPDINGNYVVRNFRSNNPKTEAEYSNVLFSLANKEEYKNKDIYIYGAFNNYQFTYENKLSLDESGKYLTCSLFLKQGFYNYDFVVYNQNNIDKKTISGSYFETENNYEALVYFQAQNAIYYQVVGYGVGNSKQQIEN
ncbi:type IX secretion system plug protein [Wenyingzhuangia sp. IMCC45467]